MSYVPPGGLILVTGANGLIAGVAVQVFLDKGYKVRGTVRDVEKNKWMLQHYGPNFSLVSVPEMSAYGAFDEAVKGVDGIAHIASTVVFKPDPKDVIPSSIETATNVLKSAAKEPKIKSVLYTSSQATCVALEDVFQGKPYTIDEWTYNEGLKIAWSAPPSTEFPRMLLNYAAGKLEAEQATWAWVKEHKPSFTFNVLVPGPNFGPSASPENTGFPSSAGLLKMLWQGHTIGATMIPNQWFMDVDDTGLLHLAALTVPGVESRRILAMTGRYDYNAILSIFKKTCPDRKFIDEWDQPLDHGTVANDLAVDLIKKMGQADGFTSLGSSIQKWVRQMIEVEGKEMPETEGDRLVKMYTTQS